MYEYVSIYVCKCMYVCTYIHMYVCSWVRSLLTLSVKVSKTVEDNAVAYSTVCIFTRSLSTAGNELSLQQLVGFSSSSGSVISHQDAHTAQTAHCTPALNTPVLQFVAQT